MRSLRSTRNGIEPRAGDQIDDDFVTHQGSPAPVLGDVAEHPVLDLVPLARSRREVAHMDGQSQAQ